MENLKSKACVEWAVLCSQSVVDKQTNNISLINLIEQIKFEIELVDKTKQFNSTDGEPVSVSMELVSRFHKLVDSDESLNLISKVDFLDPEGKILSVFENEILLDKGIQNFRMRYGIHGLKVTKSGLYNFVVHAKESHDDTFTEFSRVPLEVILVIK